MNELKKLYLFEIEADEKPIFNIGEWERLDNITSDLKFTDERSVIAYGEVEKGKYVELYDKKL